MGNILGYGDENDRNAAGVTGSANSYDQQVEAAASLGKGISESPSAQLSFSCEGVANVDEGSLTDPFCVIYMRTTPTAPWSEIKRTEVIANTLNPEWVTLVLVNYRFEELQQVKVEVYDVAGDFASSRSESLKLADQVFLGYVEFALPQVFSANDKTWSAPLVNGPNLAHQNATLQVKAEEVANQQAAIELELAAEGIETSSPVNLYVRLSRLTESGGSLPFYKTETRAVYEPVCSKMQGLLGGSETAIREFYGAWAKIDTTLQQVSNGDMYRPIVFEVFNWQRSGNHTLIGSCQASVDDLIRSSPVHPLPLIDSDNKSNGALVCRKCVHRPKHSFFEYVFGQGFEISAVVAIDFTASNGDPSHPESLHYFHPQENSLNEYTKAITGIGDVIQFYDTDKLYPVIGFGAKLAPGQPASHMFAVNFNDENPQVEGVEGIISCYKNALQSVILSGPTIFAPLINKTADMVRSTVSNDPREQQYHILLIITDGIINDMQNTTDAIVQASTLPLSIIIVGVGDANFTFMEQLDGDDEPLVSSRGVKTARDIVQFVPMRENAGKDPHEFAKEVLAEVPYQLVSYMEANGIPPPPPRSTAR